METRTSLVLIFVSLLFSSLVMAQSFEVVTVASGNSQFGPEEPSININRKKPKHQVVGTNINLLYVSKNGGKTWKQKDIVAEYGIWGDPIMLSDYDGRFYYFHLSYPGLRTGDQESWLDRMACHVSEDYGESWDIESFTGLNGKKDQDKEWACVDKESGTVYLTWTEFDKYASEDTKDRTKAMFSKSADGGKSWSDAMVISEKTGICIDDSRAVEGVIPAAGQNGRVYTVWMLNDSIYFRKSNDRGETWEKERGILPTSGWDFAIPGINRTNGFPTFYAVPNGDTEKLYLSWSDQSAGENDTEIWLSSSVDGGETWSLPTSLTKSYENFKGHQFFSNMGYDEKTGYFYWLFYDRSLYAESSLETDIILAWSDSFYGEKHFVKLNDKPFVPEKDVFFGDYIQVDAYKKIVRPVWTELNNGTLSVKTALLNQKILNKLK